MLGIDSQKNSSLVRSKASRKDNGNYTKQFYWHKCWCLQRCRSRGDFPLFSILSAAIAASQLAPLMSHVTQPFKKEQERSNLNSPFYEYISKSQILIAWYVAIPWNVLPMGWNLSKSKDHTGIIFRSRYLHLQLILSRKWILRLVEHTLLALR